MNLSNELQSLLKLNGASLIGMADLRKIPADNRYNFPYGISIGIALNPGILSEISEGPTNSYVEECLRLDNLLNELGQLTLEFLKKKGYDAKQQATTNITGTAYPPNLATPLPQKTVATLGGLGWIGKSALLITKEFGSAVRLGSILTNADLSVNRPIETSQCGNCTICSDICPAKAIAGTNWKTGMPRDSLINAIACRKNARERLIKRTGAEVVGRTFCGICISACPWTQNYQKRT